MPNAGDAAVREELRRAGLPRRRRLERLLALLRGAGDTHLSLSEIVGMAVANGLVGGRAEMARALGTLADHGLLGRLATTAAEPIFDTVPEPHSHLVYEETAQTVDLHVSHETLLAILRQMLTDRPDAVEVLVRVRRDPAAMGGAT